MSQQDNHETAADVTLLQQRVEHLEQLNRWHIDAMNMLIRMSEGYGKRKETRNATAILQATTSYVRQVADFDLIANFLVNEEDSSFELAYMEQDGSPAIDLEALKQALIDGGEFAWAISQNRTIMVDRHYIGRQIMMHVLTTKNRVRGMFIGCPSTQQPPSLASHNLISVVLQNCAHALESCALYHMVSEKNQELEQANASLEQKVIEKTRDLHSALVRAEQATKAKSQFLANMSHEIRTPMNAVVGFSTLLLQEQLSDEHHKFVQHIHASGNQLLNLINDILDFSKIEAGKIEVESLEFNLYHLLRELQGVMDFSATKKAIPLQFHLPQDLHHHLRGDPHRLKQILTNLLSNAIKFTEQGEVRLSISEQFDPTTHLVTTKFAVTDTGIGMTDAQTKNLFQSFNQADASTTRKYGGTGLGLAISQQLANLMGGDITVSSEYGVGSTFTLLLPFACVTPEVVQSAVAQRNEKTTAEKLSALHGKRILLVDDNITNQMVATAFLTRLNLDITVANDGQEAIALASQFSFDLVLMDLQMPVMDGYEATRIIRQQLPNKNLPILAMTADAMEEVEASCYAAGMDGYLTKPFDVAALHQALIRWLLV